MIPSFYNQLYLGRPGRWDNILRDSFILSHLVEVPAVTDIGCGTGHTIKFLAKHWINTKFMGVDFSNVAIDIANRHKMPNTEFFCEDFRLFRLPPADIVMSIGVMEHLKDLKELQSLRKYMRKGGILYLEIPNCLAYSSSQEEGYRKTTGGSEQEEWHLTRPSWENKIKGAGYKITTSLIGAQHSWQFIWILQ